MVRPIHEWPALHDRWIAIQDLTGGVIAVTGEPQREMFHPKRDVEHRDVRQPWRQGGINPEPVIWCVLLDPKHGLQQRERRTGSPCLGNVGTEVLNGKGRFGAADAA